MAAYSLENRFPDLPQCYPLLDPGTYETTITNIKRKTNLVPFLVKSPRVCQKGNRIWTHAIYNTKNLYKIPNCSAMLSKQPRFPYESSTIEELVEILCECDINNKCECEPKIEKEDKVESETIFRQRIFTGPFPRTTTDGGLSVPCKRDRGFLLSPDGSKKRILDKAKKDNPDFLDTEVRESTAFYHGCKWSRWTSKRSGITINDTPGPTAYNLNYEPTEAHICAEKIRFNKRKNSKQYRFIEMVQQKNLRENLPGPATYSPSFPRGTELQFMGPKAERYPSSKYNVIPGPSDYILRREFDLPEPPTKLSHAKLPEPAFFGVKAPRFKTIRHDGPGPASYNTHGKLCHIRHYPTAPFGTSSPRFTQSKDIEESTDDDDAVDTEPKNNECKNSHVSWMFKSNAERIKPLKKKLHEPSPADLVLSKKVAKRSFQLQTISPFYTSERRFRPWYNWIPVQSKEQTPGPGRFYLEKHACNPAFVRGPLYRSGRFRHSTPQAPPCTAYKIEGEIEKVLHTCNERLKQNIQNKHQFRWTPPVPKIKLSNIEKEKLLISKSIAILNTDIFGGKSNKSDKNHSNSTMKAEKKKKLLRCFL